MSNGGMCMTNEQRQQKQAAMLLKQAHNALMRAELLSVTDPETSQQIAATRASVEQAALSLDGKISLKAGVEKRKLNVSNG